MLADEPQEIAAGACGEPVKLNLGDIGDRRVEHHAATRATLAKSFPLMSAADQVNLLADSWALAEAGRAEPAAERQPVEDPGSDDSRAVWEQAINIFQPARPARARPPGAGGVAKLRSRQAAPGVRTARLGRRPSRRR